MAVTHKLYGPAMKNILDGTVDLGPDTFKVALMSSGFSFDQDHEDWADVSTHQISGTGDYTAGGIELTVNSSEITHSTGTGISTVVCSSETVFSTEGTISAHHAVVYGSTSDKLLSAVDFNGEEDSVDGEYKITWTDSKLFTITVST